MRILWLSNPPWCTSGYGTQTRVIVPRLRALGHEIALQCVPGLDGGTIVWDGMRVYPRGPHPFGQSFAGAHYRHFQADLLLTLHDAWVIEPRLLGDDVRWGAWFPCDHEGLPPQVREKLMDAWARFSFTRAGQAAAEAVGVPSGWIPLAVDTSVFRPGDREAGRRALSIPSDAYLLGMVAANQSSPSRKSFPQCFEAFARFRRRHPEALLYVHSQVKPSGPHVDLAPLIESLDLGDAVIFGDPYELEMGCPDARMAELFNAFDALLAPSMGEGFGLPVLEAQACGCPVITGAWTGTEENFFAGELIPRSGAERFWTAQHAWQMLPRVGEIEAAMERLFGRRHEREAMGRTARAGAMAFDADAVVARFWKPALDALEARLRSAPDAHGGGPAIVRSPDVPPARRAEGEVDERLLMDLASDWSERTGCFGAALGVLYGLAVGVDARRMLEVGVRFGGSTRAFLLAALRTGGRLWSIDIEDRSAHVPDELKGPWTHLVGRSVDLAKKWTEELDLLFLDGEHNYETAVQELAALGRAVRSGGLIVMDDVWDLFPGVRRAFLEYPAAAARYFLPYGVPQAQPGGRARTLGVIRKL